MCSALNMIVVSYERGPCNERVCLKCGLLWRWPVMNVVCDEHAVMNVVCCERVSNECRL